MRELRASATPLGWGDEVDDHILEVVFDHLGLLNYGLEAGTADPIIPTLKEFPGIGFVSVRPERTKSLFDAPGAGTLKVRIPDLIKAQGVLRAER